jgi:beta-glucosidase 2, glycosyl-hydrolase family 116 N-term
MPSLPGDSICAAVCASTWVEPHGRCTVVFGLSWSSPKVKFQKGCSYHRSDFNALLKINLVILIYNLIIFFVI